MGYIYKGGYMNQYGINNNGILLANYVIFRYQNKIYARNGNTEEIDYIGIDESTVIGKSIDALDDGNKIFIRNGIYTIDSTILYQKDRIVIEGEGQGTILKLADNANIDILSAGRRNNLGIIIRNLTIDGNKTNNISGRGLVFTGYYSVLDNILIKNCAGNGFDAEVPIGSTESMVDNFVHDIRVTDCNGTGFSWGTMRGGRGTDNYLQNIISWGNGGDGIDLYPAAIYGWNINSYGNGGHGTIIRGAYTRITILESAGNGGHGVRLYRNGCWKSVIVAARSFNNSRTSAGICDGFILDGDGQWQTGQASLIGCMAWDEQTSKTQNWGVNASYQADASRSVVIGGSFSGNIQTKGIAVHGNQLRAKNTNTLFENSGQAIIAAGSTNIDVAHGLVAPPDVTKLRITPRDNIGSRGFWVEVHPIDPTTYFVIKISSIDTVGHTFNWYTEV